MRPGGSSRQTLLRTNGGRHQKMKFEGLPNRLLLRDLDAAKSKSKVHARSHIPPNLIPAAVVGVEPSVSSAQRSERRVVAQK